MKLESISSLLKEASAEIKKLKEENAKLRAEMDNIKKEAASTDENALLGFGEVSQDDYSNSPSNSRELMSMYFGA